MDPQAKYILSLVAVRDRAKQVKDAAEAGRLNHFDVHESRMEEIADFVTSVINRDYGPDKFDDIPPHGRWQHFEIGKVPRITDMVDVWSRTGCDDMETTRRLIDLFFISVLLDAGAGDTWKWKEPGTDQVYERSEGIAVASLDMFKELVFTVNNNSEAPLVDGRGLEQLKTKDLASGFQSSELNPILGIESRADLLRNLGTSLLAHPDVFGKEGRPGNLVGESVQLEDSRRPAYRQPDYMIGLDSKKLDVLTLWDVLQTLLIPIWPKDRTVIAGQPVGDAWPLRVLQNSPVAQESSGIVDPEHIQPFHKLTQWLTYSLMVPFERILGLQWLNAGSLTALPEYRNGGLFVDFGALSLKHDALERGLKASGGKLPLFDPGDDVIIEWRVMTLILVDKLYEMVLSRMGNVRLSMAQLLEAGSWKSGREIAAQRRPETKSSPILLRSDGTLF